MEYAVVQMPQHYGRRRRWFFNLIKQRAYSVGLALEPAQDIALVPEPEVLDAVDYDVLLGLVSEASRVSE